MKNSTWLIIKTLIWLVVLAVLGITKTGSDRFYIFASVLAILSGVGAECAIIKEKMDQK